MFFAVTFGIGLLALVCQGVGLFSPAWTRFELDFPGEQFEIDIGFFTSHACVRAQVLLEERCTSFQTEMVKGNKGFDSVLSLDLTAYIVAIGGLFTLAGIFFLVWFSKRNSTKANGYGTAATWIFSAAIVLVAVGLHTHRILQFKEDIDAIGAVVMKLRFPWAACMSGIGSTLNLLTAGILMVFLCRKDSDVPGTWNRLTDQPI